MKGGKIVQKFFISYLTFSLVLGKIKFYLDVVFRKIENLCKA